MEDNKVKCWGKNDGGQIGNSAVTFTAREPMDVEFD
jgi:hypothetical protein